MQQSTILLPSNHPVRALTGLAKAIALPAEHAPERFPSFPALERTAVMSFNSPTSLLLPANKAVKVGVVRQATYPVWGERSYDRVYYGATYRTDLSDVGVNTGSTNNFQSTVIRHFNGPFSPADSYTPSCTTCDSLATGWAVMGMDQGTGPRPWLYIPGGANFVAVVTGLTAATGNTNINFTYELWDFPGQCSERATVTTIASGNRGANFAAVPVPSQNGIWVRPKSLTASVGVAATLPNYAVTMIAYNGGFSYAPSTSNAGAVTLTVQNQSLFVPLVAPSEFLNSILPWDGTRLLASAMLGTNVSQVLNKAGTILGGRTNPYFTTMFGATQTIIQNLHPAEKAWLPLETGVYTYCPPSTDLTTFWDYALDATNQLGLATTAPMFRLDNDSFQNVMFLTAGAVDESLAVTASWSFEFRTTSALFQIGLSGMKIETLHQAQLALSAAGFFFENPSHSKILNRVAAGIKSIAPYAVEGLKILNPALGRIAQRATRALTQSTARSRRSNRRRRRAPQQQPRKVPLPKGPIRVPPTSAQRSGMMPKRKGGLEMYLESRR